MSYAEIGRLVSADSLTVETEPVSDSLPEDAEIPVDTVTWAAESSSTESSEFEDAVRQKEGYHPCTLTTLTDWLNNNPDKQIITNINSNMAWIFRFLCIEKYEIAKF